MGGPYRKHLEDADLVDEIAGAYEQVVTLGDYTIGRVVQPPGWRWSTHMKPIIGGEWCQARHVGYVVSGAMRVYLEDGVSFVITEGDVFDIPAGHDAEVISDVPLVEIDWAGLEAWTGHRQRFHERVLAALMMIDIVSSTEALHEAGDAKWRSRLSEFYVVIRQHVERFAGREVSTTGDGMFVMFDSAADATRCAEGIRQSLERLDIKVRIGIHLGEVEVTGSDVSGLAVHEVARISAFGGGDDFLMSETAKVVLSGLALNLEDRGSHHLKGLNGERRIFALLPSSLFRGTLLRERRHVVRHAVDVSARQPGAARRWLGSLRGRVRATRLETATA